MSGQMTSTYAAPTIDHSKALNVFWQVSRSWRGVPVGKPLTVEQAFKKLNQAKTLTHVGHKVFWKLTNLVSEIVNNQNESDEVAAIND